LIFVKNIFLGVFLVLFGNFGPKRLSYIAKYKKIALLQTGLRILFNIFSTILFIELIKSLHPTIQYAGDAVMKRDQYADIRKQKCRFLKDEPIDEKIQRCHDA